MSEKKKFELEHNPQVFVMYMIGVCKYINVACFPIQKALNIKEKTIPHEYLLSAPKYTGKALSQILMVPTYYKAVDDNVGKDTGSRIGFWIIMAILANQIITPLVMNPVKGTFTAGENEVEYHLRDLFGLVMTLLSTSVAIGDLVYHSTGGRSYDKKMKYWNKGFAITDGVLGITDFKIIDAKWSKSEPNSWVALQIIKTIVKGAEAYTYWEAIPDFKHVANKKFK